MARTSALTEQDLDSLVDTIDDLRADLHRLIDKAEKKGCAALVRPIAHIRRLSHLASLVARLAELIAVSAETAEQRAEIEAMLRKRDKEG